ncbi:TPA: hypothetical protein ACY4SF_002026 [Clostridium perfringens]|uniref:hypothetical protein n=1 Tax=Clostridium perfringens TaxID=1502 RepID=UPI000AD3B751|nr:hypothetical protein [Clostridium perfringens]EHR1327698.1 hypothetical protein [Clostridium perfringens]EHR1330831.1 hypothetical protein [Clostridium perfringens]EHR1424308.1 hypothetical protein [Clostridium perfringens]MDK0668866.1 hypothetical protein [Clostridium perfringens]MDK0695468.1 hypothetical protein [Clostridium perfringens]
MAIGKGKKRVQVTFDLDNLEIIKEVSKANRHTVSDTINIMIEKYLVDEFEKIKREKK